VIHIERRTYLDPVAAALVDAVLAEYVGRYGGEGDGTPVDPAQFEPPAGAFLVAWLDGQPAGCGGWRTHPSGAAEIKRMYTVPSVRGRGVAMALLRALEESARDAGLKRVILETGHLQPEAIALYEKAGYVRIPNFGHYKNEPGVRSFGRDL
jgi:GNAT superfamily N-acetyltransferase